MDVIETFSYQLVKWLIDNDITNVDVDLGIDFGYYNDKHVIEYSLFTQDHVDEEFARFFYEYGCEKNVSIFTMSFLHEVGHALTLSSFTKEEYESFMDTLEMAHKAVKLNPKAKEHFNLDWYWHMPHEFAANIWAIDFINNHFDKVCALEKIVKTNLDTIYGDNDIVADLYQWLDQLNEEEEV